MLIINRFILFYISDINGVPFSILLNKGSHHDANFIDEHLENLLIVPTKTSPKCKKYKQYLLADSIYDTNKVKKN